MLHGMLVNATQLEDGRRLFFEVQQDFSHKVDVFGVSEYESNQNILDTFREGIQSYVNNMNNWKIGKLLQKNLFNMKL